MNEPSVLDYVKAKLMPWRGPAPEIPPAPGPSQPDISPVETAQEPDRYHLEAIAPQATVAPASIPSGQVEKATSPVKAITWPWRSLLALALALFAQRSFEPGPDRTWEEGLVLYLLAFAWLAWSAWMGEWNTSRDQADRRPVERDRESGRQIPLIIHPSSLIISLILALVAFWAFGGGLFTTFNVFIWVLAIAFLFHAFWEGNLVDRLWLAKLQDAWRSRNWNIKISSWALLVLAATLLVVFFRVYRLNLVPPEMVSDQAEKLLDVGDVLRGQTSIFFPRNTGREAFQFYLTAAVIKILGTGISYLSLKIGTTLAGLLTLIFIYLLGQEIANRRVGLLAALFAGIAYWPNVITRVGLRFTLYPFFLAPTLYYLFRGLRRQSRNDFIFAGLFLGAGLQGYTPFRIVPFVVLVAVGLYLLHPQSKGARVKTLLYLGLVVIFSFFVFLPLFRYALANPDLFSYRALTRLGSIERPLPGPAWQIFLSNTWRALTAFSWDDGEIWTISVIHRPLLDVVSGALFHLGVVLLLVRYLRRRNWLDLFLILSIPLFMLPSILSLAFPNENPAVNRASGAMVPVFLIVALALEGILKALQEKMGRETGTRLAWACCLFLLLWSSIQNYDLVFNQFQTAYAEMAWNTSEMGQVIRDFTTTIGTPESAWVVGYPYWVDTRLVGINAGYPEKDYVIMPDHLKDSKAQPGAKMFILNQEDQAGIQALQSLYPAGWLQVFHSRYPNKDFDLFMVPPNK
ncbi:MAG: glycosyltransferase family 39 protein [Omnitrophica WOR_2 bacterium]